MKLAIPLKQIHVLQTIKSKQVQCVNAGGQRPHQNNKAITLTSKLLSNWNFSLFLVEVNEQQNNDGNTMIQNVRVDDALNQLIDDTTAAIDNKSVIKNRGGKSIKSYHKNGRSNAKAQNNGGKHLNGARVQGARKSSSNHHINTFHEFTVTESTSDRIQTD